MPDVVATESEALITLQKQLDKPAVKAIVEARDEVIGRYGKIFSSENAPRVDPDDYRSFLYLQNNKHWSSLYRAGLAAVKDEALLREGLTVLLDESKGIAVRIDEANAKMHKWGKAIITAILTVAYPTKYGVWNSTSEAAMKRLQLWPETRRGDTLGQRYQRVNQVLISLTSKLGIDLWTLDALWWGVLSNSDVRDVLSIQASIQRVMDLQKQFSSTNSAAMDERGILIRDHIPSLLAPHVPAFSTPVSPFELKVEGRDGTGRKTRVPWVRLFSEVESPSATLGWYVVLLFSYDGARAYWSLNQGTTTFIGGQFVPRPFADLEARVERARTELADWANEHGLAWASMSLGDTGGLGEGYERGNVLCQEYQSGQVPDDGVILEQIAVLVEGLQRLYKAQPSRAENAVTSYLLVWNAKRSGISASELPAKLGVGSGQPSRWSTRNGHVRAGDRVYLMRVGQPPKGIAASGFVVGSPYMAAHWNGEPGKTKQYVDVTWDRAFDIDSDPPFPLSDLEQLAPEYDWTPQSSGVVIPPQIAARLEAAWLAHPGKDQAEGRSADVPPYTLDELAADVFLDFSTLDEILELWRHRQNLVLQGPPGVGKTYLARLLAYSLCGRRDDSRIEWVQFHQSYSYEEFMQGFRPTISGGFVLKDGAFVRACARARASAPLPFVLVIDEINRGNLSKIFGEALSLVEDNKRGVLSLSLANSPEAPPFTVPPNLFIVGLMNTADRALALVDYALRRRFRFVDIEPQFESPKFKQYLLGRGISRGLVEHLSTSIGELNAKIRSDKRNLGRGFEIGHSYFCPVDTVVDERRWYARVVRFEIAPLLQEYYFEDPSEAETATLALSYDPSS